VAGQREYNGAATGHTAADGGALCQYTPAPTLRATRASRRRAGTDERSEPTQGWLRWWGKRSRC